MNAVLDTEREVLKVRLLAIAAVVAGLYMQQRDIIRDPGALAVITILVIGYLGYTLALRELILPRFAINPTVPPVLVVYWMITVDATFLAIATAMAGGLHTNTFVLFPLFVMFYALHQGYRSSFFAAILISFVLAGFSYAADMVGGVAPVGTIVALQIPLLYSLAYFSGYLAERANVALQEKAAIQQFIRIESGTEGLRDVVGVFERTLGLYENWISSHINRTPEKEVMERHQFASSLDSQYSQAHYAFGKIYSETGLLPRAEEAFRLSLEIDPGFVDAHRELSAILIRQGRFEEAVTPAVAYTQAIPDDWVGYQNLAVIYQELNELDKRDAAEKLALQVSTGEDHRSLITFFERLKEEKATI